MALRDPNNRIDVLLTDVVMPEMDGEQLGREALRVSPSLKILLRSGSGDYMATDSLGHEVPFIEKPFTSEKLVAQLRMLLTKNRCCVGTNQEARSVFSTGD